MTVSSPPQSTRPGLTRQQAKTLAFIRSYITEHGLSPSYTEIGGGLGLRSRSSVHRHVHALARRGALSLVGHCQRSLSLAEDGVLRLQLPPEIGGRIRALAEQAGVTPEAIAIEALRDCLFASR